MQAVRDLLPRSLWQAMEKDLGRDEALRLLWPAVVGRSLALQTKFERIVHDGRGSTLVVSVADGEWRGPIASLGEMILKRINSFWERPVAARIEFVVGPPRVAAERASRTRSARELAFGKTAPASVGQGPPSGARQEKVAK